MMKKYLFLLCVALMAVAPVQAQDYAYLTFETTDGQKVSMPLASLSVTISGTVLTAGSQSFTLSNLSKMYFSASDETAGIQSLTIADWDAVTDIYDLQGHQVRRDQLRPGIYIVKSKDGTHKIAVK